jgi:cation/acetate symporter
MQDQRERERAKIDGRAAFAGAAYLIGIGLIFLLQRVGAPNGLVRALGPLFALAGLALLGVLTRATRVPAFFAADRAIPAPYAALGLAGIAAGLFLCLVSSGSSLLPLTGVAIGLCIGAFITAPLLRATNASALSDLLATRFPHPLLRLYFAGLMLAIGTLVAMAGFETAVDEFAGLFAASRGFAITFVAILLAMMLAPGGLAGLLWGAAASAGMLAIVLLLPIAAQFVSQDPAIAPLLQDAGVWKEAATRGWSVGDFGHENLQGLIVAASALAIGALSPLTSPAIGASGGGKALRAGAFGLAFIALLGAAAFVDLLIWPSPAGPMTSGLRSAAILLAAIPLAASGVLSASRAWGADAGRAYDRHAPMASQRLARSRIAILSVIGLCAIAALEGPFPPRLLIFAAAALTLGFVATPIALTLFARASSIHAAGAVLCSVPTALVLGVVDLAQASSESLLIVALWAAAAGFGGAALTAIISRGDRKSPPLRRDMFIDAPLDSGG